MPQKIHKTQNQGCACCHDHHDHHEQGHTGLGGILLGGGLFLAGLLLNWLLPGIPVHVVAFVAAWLILGWDVLTAAGKNLVHGHVMDENFLMSIATLGAFALREFPEAAGVMLFYRAGEFFEHKAVERSRSRIMEAVDLRPETVNRLQDGQAHVIAARDAQVGDLLLVRPGDRIPLDGEVVSGESRIDTSPITGEPVPVAVKPGDGVVSGCVNTSGKLVIRVQKPLAESMVTRILNSVENAAAGKPKIDRFITRFARVYTPIVVAVAVLTAVVPGLITGNWYYWIYTALSFLVISCPCALVLSVPLAFFSGIGAGSKRGILFKGGASIEALAGVKAVAMDKTGTITRGNFAVQQILGDESVLRLCAGCEASSTHPIAVSIVEAAREKGLALPEPEMLEEISGYGIHAKVEGKTLLCGNEKLMGRFDIPLPQQRPGGAGTRVYVAVDGHLAAQILISDTLKSDAKEAVDMLKEMDIATAMLTGDEEEAARTVAAQTGIDEVHARLLPEEKLKKIKELRQKWGPVMFVGDGINDAPVLAGADVGAAMGSGADATIEAADVVFLTGKTAAIPQALKLAERTKRIAWQNVVFALSVKMLVMVLGLAGFASMWLAVLADSGVALLCVFNAIRMLYQK